MTRQIREREKYLWEKAKKNYFDKGVKIFWLDEAEPEYTVYDFDNYRYYLGPNVQIGNLYPVYYARTFYEGQEAAGQENIINLLRCAWAGSQKYGALVWSGDIHSSFDSLRNQFAAGLNMGLAGIPWWTTDIGGFHGGDPKDPDFRELLVRWFEYGTFCPVMRLHGDREPRQPQVGTTGGATCRSGAENEVWSFGKEAFEICKKYLNLRERMKPYIARLMKEAMKGDAGDAAVILRFPGGSPQLGPGGRVPVWAGRAGGAGDVRENGEQRGVSAGGEAWVNFWTGESFEGGRTVTVPAPLDQIPLFVRNQIPWEG